MTANWSVSWQSNTGANGAATLTSTAATQLAISQWTAVIAAPR